MPKAIMIFPVIGCFVGYAGAILAGVEDGLAVIGISVLTMIAVTVGGFLFNRRSGR